MAALPAIADLSTNKGLGKLNGFLTLRSFLVGYSPTQTDVAYAKAIDAEAAKAKFKHVYRFCVHINSFTPFEQARWPEGQAAAGEQEEKAAAPPAPPAAATAPPPAPAASKKEEEEDEDDDDCDDLFGDDSDEDDEEEAKAAAARVAAAKAKKKPAVTPRSQIIFDVKVWDSETDLDALAARIHEEVAMEGLKWAPAVKKVPLAFGIFSLQIMCIVEDDKVPCTEDVSDPIMALLSDANDPESQIVQSVDIASFNKV